MKETTLTEPVGTPVADADLRKNLTRWHVAGAVVFLLLVLAFPIYRATDSSRRADARAERETALVAAGRHVWAQNCATCHGRQGEGEPGTPALNAAEFLEAATDEQIHHISAAGITGTGMPAWWVEFGGPLTDEQIRAVVAYIRSWQPTAPSRPDWRDPQPEVAEPPPAEPAEPEEPELLVVMDDRTCQPLELEVTAGEPFTLQVRNDGTGRFSWEMPAMDVHTHVPAGETVTLELTIDEAGEHEFECLGATHDQFLGLGQIHAR